MRVKRAAQRASRITGRIARAAYVCGALCVIVLGAHGLYVHVSFMEAIEALLTGEHLADLFLTVEVPEPLGEAVTWMSMKGLQSWFIPACFIAGGILLIAKRRSIWRLLS